MAAFDLPLAGAGLPTEAGVPYIGAVDSGNRIAVGAGVYWRNASGLWVPVSTADPLPGQLEADAAAVKVAPVTGVRTVTATAAELFAGASRLNGRRMMLIRNESTSIRIRVGGSSVTQQNGFPVEPGAVLQLQFHP